jgi:hypothetical protein
MTQGIPHRYASKGSLYLLDRAERIVGSLQHLNDAACIYLPSTGN